MKVIIKIDFIYSKVVVLVGEYKDIQKDIPKEFTELDGSGYMARTGFSRIKSKKYPKQCYIHSRTAAISVIAHEAVHAVSILLSEIGYQADFDNDEIVAHLVQHICERAEKSIYGK